MSEIFLINPSPNLYRWLSVIEDKNDWGLKIAVLKGKPAGPGFGPVRVEWSPETRDREVCDFPNFRPNLLAISAEGVKRLGPLLEADGEWIELDGPGMPYTAYHCLRVADALALSNAGERAVATQSGSFHSTRFAPSLRLTALPDSHAFRIPESISKIFVSAQFKVAYEDGGLTGLDFIPVPLM